MIIDWTHGSAVIIDTAIAWGSGGPAGVAAAVSPYRPENAPLAAQVRMLMVRQDVYRPGMAVAPDEYRPGTGPSS